MSKTPARRQEPEVAEQIGRYTVVREIGRGASAAVYEAIDSRMDRRVALKVLHLDPALPPERRIALIERLQREARAIARLSHPNIVQVYDVGQEGGRHFLVMELLTGTDLRERIAEGGPLAPTEAAAIVTQVAAALDATHARGIVHRDLKPSNVLLLPDGRVKMLDFGIARAGEDVTVTQTGMVVGSPAYMAPEQARGEPTTPASDIWSLGALLYEMLAGEPPFYAPNVAAVVYKAAYEQPAPLTGDAAAAEPIVLRALAKRAVDRYPTAGALAAELRAAYRADAVPSAAAMAAAAAQQQQQRHAAAAASSSRARPLAAAAGTPLKLKPRRPDGAPPRRPATVAAAPASAGPPRSSDQRRQRRLADFGIVAAWAAFGIAAVGALALRLHQASPRDAAAALPPAAAERSSMARASTPIPEATPVPVAPPPLPPGKVVSPRRPAGEVRPTVKVAQAAPSSPKPAAVAPPTPAPPKAAPHAAPSPPARLASATRPVPRPAPPKPRPAHAAAAVAVAPRPKPAPKPKPTPRQVAMAALSRNDAAEAAASRHAEGPLVGRWRGNIRRAPAMLLVDQYDGQTFSGTVTVRTDTGPVCYAVSGTFAADTGKLSFWPTQTVQGTPPTGFDLGQANGRLTSPRDMGGLSVVPQPGGTGGAQIFTWSLSR